MSSVSRSRKRKYLNLFIILKHLIPASRAPDPALTDKNIPQIEVSFLERGNPLASKIKSITSVLSSFPPLGFLPQRVQSHQQGFFFVPGKFKQGLIISPFRNPREGISFNSQIESELYKINASIGRFGSKGSLLCNYFDSWQVNGAFLFSIELPHPMLGSFTRIFLPGAMKVYLIDDLFTVAARELGEKENEFAGFTIFLRALSAKVKGISQEGRILSVMLFDPNIPSEYRERNTFGGGVHVTGDLIILGSNWAKRAWKDSNSICDFNMGGLNFPKPMDSIYRLYKSRSLIRTLVSPSGEIGKKESTKNVTLVLRDNTTLVRGVYGVQLELKTLFGTTYSRPFFLDEGPGYRILEGHGLELIFNKNEVRRLITGLLFSRRDVLKPLLLKYYIYERPRFRYGPRYDLDRIALLLLGLADPTAAISISPSIKEDLNQLIQLFNHPEGFIKKDMITEGKFIDFCIDVLLHTLSHLLKLVLCKRYGVTELDLISTFTSLKRDRGTAEYVTLREDEVSLLITEDSDGGMGVAESFEEEREEGKMSMKRLFTEMLRRLKDKHGENTCLSLWADHVKTMETMPSIRKILEAQIAFRKRLKELNMAFSSLVGINLPLEFVRLLIDKDKILRQEKEKMYRESRGESYPPIGVEIITLIDHEIPFCWDGCVACIRLERGCDMQPYDQVFLLSRRLAENFLEAILDEKEVESKMKTSVGEIVHKNISSANQIVRICTPFLNTEILKDITRDALRRDVRVRLLISRSKKLSRELRSALLQLINANPGLLEVRFLSEKFIHAKIYIVDDRVAIVGSPNLTFGGLYENIEVLSIHRNKAEVYKLISDFERHFAIAVPLLEEEQK